MKTRVDSPQSACRIGIARGDITPPANIYQRMWGAATHDRAEGIHRPLTASVIVFEPLSPRKEFPDDRQVVVAVDHCLMGVREHDELVEAIVAATGWAAESILVTCSHTHAAGLMSYDRESLPGGDLIPPYLRAMNESIAGLAAEAKGNLQAAFIQYNAGRCDLAANRDYWDTDSGQWVCGFNPGAAADDTVLVARAAGENGDALAVIVNYACHPTTLAWDNRLISPDFPGAMREVVEREFNVPCVFLQGASGELGPVEGFVGDVAIADRNGRQLGYSALAALSAIPTAKTDFEYAGPVVSGATIGTWQRVPLNEARQDLVARWETRRVTLDLPYRPGLSTHAEAEARRDAWLVKEAAARDGSDEAEASRCRAMVERETRLMSRLSGLPPGETYPYRITLWRLGDAVWIGLQGEPYSLLQTELRRRFPGTPLMVQSISGRWGPSYLPPADLYEKGIYQESIAVLAAGALERIIDTTAGEIELLLK